MHVLICFASDGVFIENESAAVLVVSRFSDPN